MRFSKAAAMMAVALVVEPLVAQGPERPGPLPQFQGQYQLSGRVGTVRVAGALGGAYTEWAVSIGQPSHEVRMMVGPRKADGTFPVWRFEQDPAPDVANEGTARLEGRAFVADFYAAGEPQKMLRERWTLGPDGSLQFDLEAAQGGGPQRVGGFTANRRPER